MAIDTLYSRVRNDPDEVHHPEEECSIRARIVKEGNGVMAKAEVPSLLSSDDLTGFDHVVATFDEHHNIRTLPWCSDCVAIRRGEDAGSREPESGY